MSSGSLSAIEVTGSTRVAQFLRSEWNAEPVALNGRMAVIGARPVQGWGRGRVCRRHGGGVGRCPQQCAQAQDLDVGVGVDAEVSGLDGLCGSGGGGLVGTSSSAAVMADRSFLCDTGPLMVGGFSKIAARRTARYGYGFDRTFLS
jgi:hypothetical protein